MGWFSTRFPHRDLAWLLGGLVLGAAGTASIWFWGSGKQEERAPIGAGGDGQKTAAAAALENTVWMDSQQQQTLGIVTTPVTTGAVSAVFRAPGQVVPDESQYAYITPRVQGIIREVKAQIGQFVKKGDLLVTIDSSAVAQARLSLIDALMRLELARTKLDWQETIYQNSLDLIEALRKDPDPEQVQKAFASRPVGKTREQLLTAYAQYHLSGITSKRYANLSEKDAVSVALSQQKQAAYQVDKATFQGLMDRMSYEVRLDHTLARQELRESRTAVKVTRETLRVYGVPIDKIAERFKAGELSGARLGGEPKKTLRELTDPAPPPSQEIEELMKVEGEPVSTYELRAPFDGTVLERERIVPGVIVDGTHRLFTMAGLDTVWVEAYVHESDFDLLSRSRGGSLEFTSPAYPKEVFKGQVLYTGDMVDPKSRMVRMLGTAKNPQRMLKPGMFVNIEISSEDVREVPKIPASALLTENDAYFVFVQIDPEHFERRQVLIGARKGDGAAIDRGLKQGERVVIRGAFELKSKAQTPRLEAGGD